MSMGVNERTKRIRDIALLESADLPRKMVYDILQEEGLEHVCTVRKGENLARLLSKTSTHYSVFSAHFVPAFRDDVPDRDDLPHIPYDDVVKYHKSTQMPGYIGLWMKRSQENQ